jgi:surface polysaccharide O-acyltransferase-like enzyme
MKTSEALKAEQPAAIISNSRNYGIDLLRLVLMFMVCVLHTLGQGGILDVHQGTQNNVFWFLEIAAYCAVDGFALISGYTAADKPRRYEKLAEMWFQVFFYSFVITVVLTVTNLNPDWLPKDIIKSALPVTAEIYWYFSAYFALFFVTPVLNKFLFSLDERGIRIVLFITVALFSFVGLPADAFKTQSGYSAA